MAEFQAGRDALAHIDRALADRPKRDGATLKVAIQDLATFRDHFIARHRSEGGTGWRPALERVNAVVSVVMAAEFPIGEVPWDELVKGRDWLDAFLRDEAGQ
jgi:hypothetical protein